MSDKYKPERDIDTVTVTSVKGDNNHKVQTTSDSQPKVITVMVRDSKSVIDSNKKG